MVNFMGIPENEIYQMLFETNKALIMDHYRNTNNDMEAVNCLIVEFYNLYFNDDYTFRGARRLDFCVGMREDVSEIRTYRIIWITMIAMFINAI